jgi:hypothetical protein
MYAHRAVHVFDTVLTVAPARLLFACTCSSASSQTVSMPVCMNRSALAAHVHNFNPDSVWLNCTLARCNWIGESYRLKVFEMTTLLLNAVIDSGNAQEGTSDTLQLRLTLLLRFLPLLATRSVTRVARSSAHPESPAARGVDPCASHRSPRLECDAPQHRSPAVAPT